MELDRRAVFTNAAAILFGTAVYAFGLNYFIVPNQLMEGGITGIALLVDYTFDVRPSVMTVLIILPLVISGLRVLGRRGMSDTNFVTAPLSAASAVHEMVCA